MIESGSEEKMEKYLGKKKSEMLFKFDNKDGMIRTEGVALRKGKSYYIYVSLSSIPQPLHQAHHPPLHKNFPHKA